MMEFNFADDLFGENEERTERLICKPTDYIPKQYSDKWFFKNDINGNCGSEDSNILKYQADYFYACKSYEQAYEKYTYLSSVLSSTTNLTMLRDNSESIVRCCLKLHRYEEAFEKLPDLVVSVSNPVDTSVYMLGFDICKLTGRLSEAVSYLQKAIAANPQYTEYHYLLYRIYKELFDKRIETIVCNGTQIPLTTQLLYKSITWARTSLSDSLRGKKHEMSKKNKDLSNKIEEELNLFDMAKKAGTNALSFL